MTIIATPPLTIDAFEIKYTQSDNGKKFATAEQTHLTKLSAIQRATHFTAVEIPVTAPSEPKPKPVPVEESNQIRLDFDETED
jgi:hypothetical protein